MTVGLLLCDHVDEELSPEHGTYFEMFQRWLPALHLQPYYVCNGEFPRQTRECEAYIVNGSRHSVYDPLPWIMQLLQLVRDIHREGIPYVGICFGHQLLAQALGGVVRPSEKGWCVGIHRFTVHGKLAWMQPSLPSYQALMMCQDQVQQLPDGSQILAGTLDCKVGMFQLGNHMLGIQAHPEFSRSYNQVLMQKRENRIGHEKVSSGIKSLDQKLHAKDLAEWVTRFILYKA